MSAAGLTFMLSLAVPAAFADEPPCPDNTAVVGTPLPPRPKSDAAHAPITIESDDNAGFTTPTVRQTLTAVITAPNRIVATLNGPIATDDRWRAVLTKTGGTSIVAAVTFSLEPIF